MASDPKKADVETVLGDLNGLIAAHRAYFAEWRKARFPEVEAAQERLAEHRAKEGDNG